MKKNTRFSTTVALMLVLFIDGMGQGIIFPILSNTLTNTNSTLFFESSNLLARHLWFGLIIGAYYFMWFITAPLLGDWSDRAGRKKPLLICLSLAAISFLLSAFAFDIGSLSLLLIARLMGGATSGDQAIAKAAIIDICPENKKPVYLGLILCSVTLGLVVGPLIGAYLQNPSIYPNFNSQTPLYFSAFISLLNILLLQPFFKEKSYSRVTRKLKMSKSIYLVLAGFKAAWIRKLLITYCLTQLGWQIFYIDMQNFLINKFHVSDAIASNVLALAGIGIFLGLAVLPNLFKKINHKKSSVIGYSMMAISLVTVLLSHRMLVVYLCVVIASAFFGLAAVNILAMFSKQADTNQQGWVMGVTGSVVALTGGLGALITGVLSSLDITAPYTFALTLIFLGIIVFNKKNAKV